MTDRLGRKGRNAGALCVAAFVSSLASVFLTTPAGADTLMLLEHERALYVNNQRAASYHARYSDVTGDAAAEERLLNLEKLVIRDDRLLARSTPIVVHAFADYDLTFLVLSAREKRMTPMAVWLTQLGISAETISETRLIGE